MTVVGIRRALRLSANNFWCEARARRALAALFGGAVFNVANLLLSRATARELSEWRELGRTRRFAYRALVAGGGTTRFDEVVLFDPNADPLVALASVTATATTLLVWPS